MPVSGSTRPNQIINIKKKKNISRIMKRVADLITPAPQVEIVKTTKAQVIPATDYKRYRL